MDIHVFKYNIIASLAPGNVHGTMIRYFSWFISFVNRKYGFVNQCNLVGSGNIMLLENKYYNKWPEILFLRTLGQKFGVCLWWNSSTFWVGLRNSVNLTKTSSEVIFFIIIYLGYVMFQKNYQM